jgi:hypothetical protein
MLLTEKEKVKEKGERGKGKKTNICREKAW